MGDGTEISWTDATWNPITGCSIKSLGCNNCYAMKLASGRLRNHASRAGLTQQTKSGPVWTGEVRFNEGWLDQPLRWKSPRDIFVVAHGDLFHPAVPDAWIDRVMAVMILGHQHRFQVLTKRPERAVEYLSGGRALYDHVLRAARPLRDKRPHLGDVPIDDPAAGAFHPNIWIGTSVERQQEADERRPHLEEIAAMGFSTWVSYEPALGLVDWRGWQFIRWLVSGGESDMDGKSARPSHPDWHRVARDFASYIGIPYHLKQRGSWTWDDFDLSSGSDDSGLDVPMDWRDHPDKFLCMTNTGRFVDGLAGRSETFVARVGKRAAGHLLDGREHREFPRGEG